MKEREHFLPLHIGDDFVQHYLNRVFLYLSPTGYSDFSPETISRRDNIITSGYTFSHRRGDLGISYSEEGCGCGRLAYLVDFASKADPHRRFACFASLAQRANSFIYRAPPDIRLFVRIKYFCCLTLLLPGGSVIAKRIKQGQPVEWKDLLSKDVADEWVLFYSMGLGKYLRYYGYGHLGFFTRGISFPLQVTYLFLYGFGEAGLYRFRGKFRDLFLSLGLDIDYLISKLSGGVCQLIKEFDPVSVNGGLALYYATGYYWSPWVIDDWGPTFVSLPSSDHKPFFDAEDMFYCKKIIQGLTRARLSLAVSILRAIHEGSLAGVEGFWRYRPDYEPYCYFCYWEQKWAPYDHIFQFMLDHITYASRYGFNLLWICWHLGDWPGKSLINFDWDSSDKLLEEYAELLFTMVGIFEVYQPIRGIRRPDDGTFRYYTGLLGLPTRLYWGSGLLYEHSDYSLGGPIPHNTMSVAYGGNYDLSEYWTVRVLHYYECNKSDNTEHVRGEYYSFSNSSVDKSPHQFYYLRNQLISYASQGNISDVCALLFRRTGEYDKFLEAMQSGALLYVSGCGAIAECEIASWFCNYYFPDIENLLERFPVELNRVVLETAEYLVEIYSASWRHERFKKLALSFVGSFYTGG